MTAAAPEPIPVAELHEMARAAGWDITTTDVLAVAPHVGHCRDCERTPGQAHTKSCPNGTYQRKQFGGDGTVTDDDCLVFREVAAITGATVRTPGQVPADIGVVNRGYFHPSDLALYRKLERAASKASTGQASKPSKGTGSSKSTGK